MSYWQSGRDPKELPSMLWSTIVTDEPWWQENRGATRKPGDG
jgi:hypothetical protein